MTRVRPERTTEWMPSPADGAGEDGEEDEAYEAGGARSSDEDDIVRYLEDEDGNRHRLHAARWRTATECEYLLRRGRRATAPRATTEDNPYDLGITKEGVAEATNDMNAIYKDGIAVAAELKGAFDDIKSAFDFKGILKK